MAKKKDPDDYAESWVRVKARIATLERGAGREEAWLVEKLGAGATAQMVHNWTTRGIPPSKFQDVAAAIRWSVGQVAGVKDPPEQWPFETIAPERLAGLTPRQMAMIEIAAEAELRRIEDAIRKQMRIRSAGEDNNVQNNGTNGD